MQLLFVETLNQFDSNTRPSIRIDVILLQKESKTKQKKNEPNQPKAKMDFIQYKP